MPGMDLHWGAGQHPDWGTKPHHARHGTTEGRESKWRWSPKLFVPRQGLLHQTLLPLQTASKTTSGVGDAPMGTRPTADGDLQYPESTDSQTRPAGAKPTQLHLSFTFREQLGNVVPSSCILLPLLSNPCNTPTSLHLLVTTLPSPAIQTHTQSTALSKYNLLPSNYRV